MSRLIREATWISSCGSPRRRASPAGIRPWGRGRPGWHIECSAMSWKYLGESLRHPRRRHRSRLPAPRKRNRPDALRLRPSGHGQGLDAQWLPAGRRRENVEEPRQFRDHPRCPWHDWPGEVAAARHAEDALSPADRLDRRERFAKPSANSIAGIRFATQFAASAAMLPPDFIDALEDDLNIAEALDASCAGFMRRPSKASRWRARGSPRPAASSGFSKRRCRNGSAGGRLRPGSTNSSSHRRSRSAQRRAGAQGLGGIRPHSRRTRRDGHRAQGQQGRHDELGGEADERRQCKARRSASDGSGLRRGGCR